MKAADEVERPSSMMLKELTPIMWKPRRGDRCLGRAPIVRVPVGARRCVRPRNQNANDAARAVGHRCGVEAEEVVNVAHAHATIR